MKDSNAETIRRASRAPKFWIPKAWNPDPDPDPRENLLVNFENDFQMHFPTKECFAKLILT